MSHPAPSYVECWGLAADPTGIWLVPSDAIWDGPVDYNSGPTGPFVNLGRIFDELGYPSATPGERIDVRPGILTNHFTSWRWDMREGNKILLTAVAALEVPDGAYVPDLEFHSRTGLPIGGRLFDHTGRPAPHLPGQAPMPRDIDVLWHGIRHLSFLTRTNDVERDALGPLWGSHLRNIEPRLSGMYQHGDGGYYDIRAA